MGNAAQCIGVLRELAGRSNGCVNGVSEEEEGKKGAEIISEEIWAMNFPKLMKPYYSQGGKIKGKLPGGMPYSNG